jgi:hypothetical protein
MHSAWVVRGAVPSIVVKAANVYYRANSFYWKEVFCQDGKNGSWCVLRRGYRFRAFDHCSVFCQGEKNGSHVWRVDW